MGSRSTIEEHYDQASTDARQETRLEERNAALGAACSSSLRPQEGDWPSSPPSPTPEARCHIQEHLRACYHSEHSTSLIAPVFRRSAFVVPKRDPVNDTDFYSFSKETLPEDIYNEMLPGLRLATLLMIEAEPHFKKLYIARTMENPLKRGESCLDPDYMHNESQNRRFEHLISRLNSGLYIEFLLDDQDRNFREQPGGARIYGCTKPAVKKDLNAMASKIQLNTQFLDYFSDQARSQPGPNKEFKANQQYQVMLATTMVHELCHAISWMRRSQQYEMSRLVPRREGAELPSWSQYMQQNPEARYHPSSRKAEHGWSCEHFLLGVYLTFNDEENRVKSTHLEGRPSHSPSSPTPPPPVHVATISESLQLIMEFLLNPMNINWWEKRFSHRELVETRAWNGETSDLMRSAMTEALCNENERLMGDLEFKTRQWVKELS